MHLLKKMARCSLPPNTNVFTSHKKYDYVLTSSTYSLMWPFLKYGVTFPRLGVRSRRPKLFNLTARGPLLAPRRRPRGESLLVGSPYKSSVSALRPFNFRRSPSLQLPGLLVLAPGLAVASA